MDFTLPSHLLYLKKPFQQKASVLLKMIKKENFRDTLPIIANLKEIKSFDNKIKEKFICLLCNYPS